ncbi:MAG: HlyD family efflux transporter periplasmic adaptor subunit [Kiritimatiellae bacterium]|nr:HlyD family efflux transporter periplasmic adaptor subunit [Kiritimatiellia bacterium]
MRVFRLAMIVTLTIGVLLLVGGLFMLLVKMDFFVHVRGRIEPARMLTLSLPRGGRVAFCAAATELKEGELVVALDATAEQAVLESLARIEEILVKQREHELVLRAASKREHAEEVKRTEKELDLLRAQLEAEEGQLHTVAAKLTDVREEQKRLAEGLRRDEVSILTALKKDGLVTQSDLELARYRASLAESELSETRLTAEEDQLRRQMERERLQTDVASKADTLAMLKQSPGNIRNLLEIERRLEENRQSQADLKRVVEEKKLHAPFDGRVLHVAATPGEMVSAGQVLATFADTSAYVFRATANPDTRVNLHEGLSARITLDTYPARVYDYLPAKVAAIETQLAPEQEVRYRITLNVNGHNGSKPGAGERPPFELVPGLPGTADIVTFHGTTVQYLMNEE